MSAESNMLRSASRQTSTRRVASATSLAPHDLKNSLPPPKVPVPRLSTGTLKPEAPSRLNSIVVLSSSRPANRLSLAQLGHLDQRAVAARDPLVADDALLGIIPDVVHDVLRDAPVRAGLRLPGDLDRLVAD